MRERRPAVVQRFASTLLLIGVLCLPTGAVWAQDTTNSDAAVAARVAALLDVLSAAPAQADAPVAALEALQADGQLSLAAREQTLHELALQLRGQAESAAGRQALQWLTTYESQVLDQHEGRGPATIPRWRVAGVARGTLELWDRAAAAGQAQRSAGAMDLSAEMAQAESTQDATALAQAVQSVPTAELVANRDRLLAAMAQSDMPAPAVAAAALRLQDADLLAAVLASGDRQTAARLIGDIGKSLPANKAFPILQTASQDEHLASAAIVQIGRLATELPAARGFLLEALADPQHGGSAAAALAALDGDEAVFDVTTELAANQDETFQSKAVLMLVLNGSPLARESLRDFATRNDVSRELRQEINDWLGEAPQ